MKMNKTTVFVGIVVLLVVSAIWFFSNQKTQLKQPKVQEAPIITELQADSQSGIKTSLELTPKKPTAGEETTLTFAFKDNEGSPVKELMVHHDRLVHVLLVGEDLGVFGHVHPEDFGKISQEDKDLGRYSVKFTFPKAGRYIVSAGIMVDNQNIPRQFVIQVAGDSKLGSMAKDKRWEKCFKGYPQDGHDRYINPVFIQDAEVDCPQGYKVSMSSSNDLIKVGQKIKFTFNFEKDEKPLHMLSPYLGAGAHLAIVEEGLGALLHRHGTPKGVEHEMEEHKQSSLPKTFGPTLVSGDIIFPKSGTYQIFAQAKHEDEIIFSAFAVEVQSE